MDKLDHATTWKHTADMETVETVETVEIGGKGRLHLGDCLGILRACYADNQVDAVVTDPP